MSRNTCEFKIRLLKLDIMVDKMKLLDYSADQKYASYADTKRTRVFCAHACLNARFFFCYANSYRRCDVHCSTKQ